MNYVTTAPVKQGPGPIYLDAQNMTEEYQIRSATGRVVMTFTSKERALSEGRARGLAVFCVVTLHEQIAAAPGYAN